MRKQLFGLRKAPVNKMLKQMKIGFQSKNAQLKLELERLKEDNQKLDQQIEEKSYHKRNEMNNVNMEGLAQDRLAAVIQYMEEKKELEAEEMITAFEVKNNAIKQKIEELETEIQSIEQALTHFLEQFVYKIDHPSNTDEKEPETEAHYAKNEAAASLETVVVAAEAQANANSFWGEVETWSNSTFTLTKNEPALDSADTDLMQIDEEFAKTVTEEETISGHSNVNEQEKRFVQAESFEEIHNDAILEQIDSVKTQYIVGKVAGEDLYDIHGRLIVARNSLITREIIEKANRNGKLAELIVNMKLTGGGVA